MGKAMMNPLLTILASTYVCIINGKTNQNRTLKRIICNDHSCFLPPLHLLFKRVDLLTVVDLLEKDKFTKISIALYCIIPKLELK